MSGGGGGATNRAHKMPTAHRDAEKKMGESGNLFIIIWPRGVDPAYNSRGRAQDPTCVAIKTNTAACIIALLAARAAQKFRLRLKNLFLFFASHYELGSVLSAQKKKTCRVRGLLFDARVCVRPRVLSQGALVEFCKSAF